MVAVVADCKNRLLETPKDLLRNLETKTKKTTKMKTKKTTKMKTTKTTKTTKNSRVVLAAVGAAEVVVEVQLRNLEP